MNGGCYFEPNEPTEDNFKVLATYSSEKTSDSLMECNDKIAILECWMGKGKCVLSGAHFEFDANKLDMNNKNLRQNVFDKLMSTNYDDSIVHTNYYFIKNLFEKAFGF